MGQVWAARLRGARGFHKLVAIKTMLPAPGEAARMEQMLLDEARIAALVQHSNVAQTLELGEHEGTLYLVMEWVDGEPLSDVLAGSEHAGGIPHLVAVNLVAQTLRGLQAAHELHDDAGVSLGVVHRDVSPDNVLVTYSGIAKLVDFGIARSTNQRASFGDGAIEGTLGYMAPEQLLGGAIDQRTDLFAAGVLLYLLTVGRHPFGANNTGELASSIVSERPAIRPSLLKPNYSRTLEAVVLKALEKDRERRWPSAEEMRLALQRGVPEAFELGCEAQLRTFMADTVGERATRKRDALRRAEASIDSAVNAIAPSAGAISATSLRAIVVAVDSSARDEESERPRSRVSQFPTLRPSVPSLPSLPPPPPHRRGWRPMIAVAFSSVAALSIGLFLLHPLGSTPHAASAPATPMVDLNPPRAASAAVPPAASVGLAVSASAARPASGLMVTRHTAAHPAFGVTVRRP
jgi:serine/threonine protein kinase